MDIEIDVCSSVCSSKVHFILSPELWGCFNSVLCTLINCTWNEVKFLDSNKNMHPSMNNLPANKGGIYAFVAKPNIIPDTHIYIYCILVEHYILIHKIYENVAKNIFWRNVLKLKE